MLGGGIWTSQNLKKIPGAYINFVSTSKASTALSARGIAAIALPFDWAPDGIFEVANDTYSRDAMRIFGYTIKNDKLARVCDIFKNATTVYFYNLNAGGAKATCKYGTAKYSGVRGNDIVLVIEANTDSTYTVKTILDKMTVDTQTVASSAALIDNSWIVFDKTATLEASAGTAFTGGTNADNAAAAHVAFLNAIESYAFNCIGCIAADATTKKLYTAFIERMRDTVGMKAQLVISNYGENAIDCDYEGIIQVGNVGSEDVVPWLTGAEAGCAVNATLTNRIMDGKASVTITESQDELERGIENGVLYFHNVSGTVRVLEDINSLTTVTETKSADFASNQTIRVIDQIGNDIAAIFNNRYLGKVQNNDAGRTSFWSDICSHHQALEALGAIEEFSTDDVVVDIGQTKNSVVVSDAVTPVWSMEKLFMTVYVS